MIAAMMKSLAAMCCAMLLAGLATPAFAEADVDLSDPAPKPPPELVRVAMVTELGTIVLDLDKTNAPITTANFLRYVDQKRFDGTGFYRVMKLDWGTQPNGLIQGGTANDPRRELKPIKHEPTDQTGILHKAGTISMARYAPGTATGDFSIMLQPQPGLDAQPGADNPEARAGFAAFGQVVEGMDTVHKIYAAPISTTKGEGFMRGQMIEKPVRIISVRRVVKPAAARPATPAPAKPAAP